MIKIYEEFTEEFKKKMYAFEKIGKLYDKIISLFNSLDIDNMSYTSHKTSNNDIISEFYILTNYKYIIGNVTLKLTTGMVSGNHGVTMHLEIRLARYSEKDIECVNKFESFLHFLVFVFDPGDNYSYFDEFTDNVNIDDVDKIMSKINIENYKIWKDSAKYNL